MKSLDLIERSADVKPQRYQQNLSMVEITRTDTCGSIDRTMAFVHWIWFQSNYRKSESDADKLEGRQVTVAESDDKVREYEKGSIRMIGIKETRKLGNAGNACRKF